MWFANFFVAGSMTMVSPFISLYIRTFGNFSDSYVQQWSGWIFAITFVTAFLFSPIWGRIGDKYGRKNILIISAAGLGLTVFLMGFAGSVWQLFLLRLIGGVFTGFIPMSQALISVQTPANIAGRILGTLQTGSVFGTLMGPLLGGILADQIGYSLTFKWISMTIFLSAIIVFLGIKEMQVKVTSVADSCSYSSKEVICHILRSPVLLVVMLISMLVQIAHFSIQPILPLYVIELYGLSHIALMSGITFSVGGLGNLFMARWWGTIGDRIGYLKVFIILYFVYVLLYFQYALVTYFYY